MVCTFSYYVFKYVNVMVFSSEIMQNRILFEILMYNH